MKSPNAFRTISEVAGELDVPQHVLRFWETRFSQVRPTKRGGGRRYYRPEDVALLKGIRRLLYNEGFTIKGVQKILREHGVQHVATTYGDAASGSVRDNVTQPAATDGGRALSSSGIVQLRPHAPSPKTGLAEEPVPGLRGHIQAALDEIGSLKALLDRARG